MDSQPPVSTECPQCRQDVPQGAPYCPNCGARTIVGAGAPRPMSRGLLLMLIGLGLFGLAGFVFFVSCLGMGSGPGEFGLIASAVLALAGLIVMGVGFVLSMLGILRR